MQFGFDQSQTQVDQRYDPGISVPSRHPDIAGCLAKQIMPEIIARGDCLKEHNIAACRHGFYHTDIRGSP
jgi:hypothetical protein